MVGGSLHVLRLPPPLKLVAMTIAEILLKVVLNTINQIKSNQPNNDKSSIYMLGTHFCGYHEIQRHTNTDVD